MFEHTHKDICFCPSPRKIFRPRFNTFSSICTIIVLILFSRTNWEVNGNSIYNFTVEGKTLRVAVPGKNLTIVWLFSSKVLPKVIKIDVENGIISKEYSRTIWKVEVINKSQTKEPENFPSTQYPFTIFNGQTEIKYSNGRYELTLKNVPKNITDYTIHCIVEIDDFVHKDLAVKFQLAVGPKILSKFGNPITKAVKGKSLEQICEADGLPVPVVKWQKDVAGKGIQTLKKGLKTVNLDIQEVKTSDAGRYICRAENIAGTVESDIHVRVKYLEVQDSKRIYKILKIGDTLRLECPIKGYPSPTYEWFKGNTQLGGERFYNGRNLEDDDFGNYSCKASNDMGERVHNFSVSKAFLDMIIKNGSLKNSLKIGETLRLECPISGSPIPTYKWYKGNQTIAQLLGTRKAYSVKMNGDQAFGEYICKASNTVGEKETSFAVTKMHDIPEKEKKKSGLEIKKDTEIKVEKEKKSDREVSTDKDTVLDMIIKNGSLKNSLKLGETLRLECPISGSPIPTYKWYKGNQTIAQLLGTRKTYSVKMNGDQAFGEYICKASNTVGEKETSFAVTKMHDIPEKEKKKSGLEIKKDTEIKVEKEKKSDREVSTDKDTATKLQIGTKTTGASSKISSEMIWVIWMTLSGYFILAY